MINSCFFFFGGFVFRFYWIISEICNVSKKLWLQETAKFSSYPYLLIKKWGVSQQALGVAAETAEFRGPKALKQDHTLSSSTGISTETQRCPDIALRCFLPLPFSQRFLPSRCNAGGVLRPQGRPVEHPADAHPGGPQRAGLRRIGRQHRPCRRLQLEHGMFLHTYIHFWIYSSGKDPQNKHFPEYFTFF